MKLDNRDISYINNKIKLLVKEGLEEKAVSKAQQRFMGMVLDKKRHPKKKVSKSVAKAAAGMSKKDIEDFASTKHKGLPNHVDEFKISKKNILLKEDEPVAAPAPAADPNAAGAMPVPGQAPVQTNTPDAIDKAKAYSDELNKKNNVGVTANTDNNQTQQQDNDTNNNNNQAQQTNNTQGQPADATAANQATAPVKESLTEADLKYISRKAISILREWTK